MKTLVNKIKSVFGINVRIPVLEPESWVEKCRREQRGLCESLGIVGDFNPTPEDLKVYEGLSQAILSDAVSWVKNGTGRIHIESEGCSYGTNNTVSFNLNNFNYKIVESSHYFGACLLGDTYRLYSQELPVFSTKFVATTLGGKLFSLMKEKQKGIDKSIDEAIKLKIQQQDIVAKQQQEEMALKVINSLEAK